jgi:hypothetical protein
VLIYPSKKTPPLLELISDSNMAVRDAQA